MANEEKEATLKTLSQALWFHVGQVIDEKTIPQNRNVTPQYIAALAQLVWTQIENVAQDLEAFANHAGRTTVSTDDVLLLCRRNEDLHELVKAFVDKEKAATAKAKAKTTAAGGSKTAAAKRGPAKTSTAKTAGRRKSTGTAGKRGSAVGSRASYGSSTRGRGGRKSG